MFDYDNTDTKADVVSSVADAIRSSHRLAPLTDEQKIQRRIQQEIYREEQTFLSEQRRAERERREQEAEAIARHEAAVALAEANRQLRLKQQERDREFKRDQRLGNLEIKAKLGEVWQSHVEAAARNAVAVRNQQALLVDVERFLTPPAPEPELTSSHDEDDGLGSPNIGDEDFNPAYWLHKRPKPIFRR